MLKGFVQDIPLDNGHGSGAKVATAKVAMLYEQAPEARFEDRANSEEAHVFVESVIDPKNPGTIKNAIA